MCYTAIRTVFRLTDWSGVHMIECRPVYILVWMRHVMQTLHNVSIT